MSDIVTLNDVEFGERLDHERASLLITQIQSGFDVVSEDLHAIRERIKALYSGRGWEAMGYGSWPELCEAQFRGHVERLDRVARQSFVAELSAEGLSTRAIAPVVGVGKSTVDRDISHVSRGGTRGVGSEIAEPATTTTTTTTTTIGRDGRMYTSSRALPAQRAEKVKAPREIATLAKRKLIAQAGKTDLDIGVQHLDPVDRVELAGVAREYAAALLALADSCDAT